MKKSISVLVLAILALFCIYSSGPIYATALTTESGTVNVLGDGGGAPGPGVMDDPSIGDGGGAPGPG